MLTYYMLLAGAWPVTIGFVEQGFKALDVFAPYVGIEPMTSLERKAESHNLMLWLHEKFHPVYPVVFFALCGFDKLVK